MSTSLLFVMLMLGGLFLSSNTPHILITSLLLSTLFASITLGSMKAFPWVAYILFLVFLGGILILFTYVSSLSSNLLFKKVKLEILIPVTLLAVMTLFASYPPALTESWECQESLPSLELAVKDLLSPLTYPLYLYLFTYLLIALLYVVTLMKTYYAPLRKTL
uniref:NADH dehydrogenase subunit 6 n=1 Tax=Proasellus karamani TaxID=1281987 RepID=A0A485M8Y8_9CRUS|nr:NADH dehydrogenase subunit 6 [Proasellus karamani]